MAAPTFQSAGTFVAGTGVGSFITPAWPTHVAGDVALLLVITNNEAFEFAYRNGFGVIGHPPEAQGAAGIAGSTRLSVYWCRARSSAMRAPRIWVPPLSLAGAVILTFRGCVQTGNPWNSTFGNGAASSTAVTIPIQDTTLADCLIVAAVSNATDTLTAQASGWTDASLTSVTERFDENTTTGFGGGVSVATGIKATAGSMNAMTATLATASLQAHISLALKPAVTPGPTSLYAFLTLQDPDAPDSEMTFKVTSFREESPAWSGERERAFAGNFLDSRHDRKRTYRASVDLPDPDTLAAFEDFIDLGPEATTGLLLGPRPLYLRGDPFGAIRGESFVEVEVTVDSLTPIENMDGGWAAELVLEEA